MLEELISNKSARVAIIGLGYVGLPLAITCANSGFQTIGFDTDDGKIEQLNNAGSYIAAVEPDVLKIHVDSGMFKATSNFKQLSQCDVVIICVPTPLGKENQPDLSFVTNTTREILHYLRPQQLIVLESTTYPGTSQEVLLPILESGGMESGSDFYLGYSPEREDPGNAKFQTSSIPKVVAGHGDIASRLVENFYRQIIDEVVVVSSLAVAEAVKITENVFRAVNIALVNELKLIYDKLDIDVWEVIDAAATKPFGYMPFYPGPGLGGHCIPIDPFYLAWKARQNGMTTRFIELAGEINVAMPAHIVGRLETELALRFDKKLEGAQILVIGLAYKKNIPDIRESPSLSILKLLDETGASATYHDPYVSIIPPTREYADLAGRVSVDLTKLIVTFADAVLIVTDHDEIDYSLIAENAKLVIDTRNAMDNRKIAGNNLVKA